MDPLIFALALTGVARFGAFLQFKIDPVIDYADSLLEPPLRVTELIFPAWHISRIDDPRDLWTNSHNLYNILILL